MLCRDVDKAEAAAKEIRYDFILFSSATLQLSF